MEVAQPKDLQQDFVLAKRRYAELGRQKRVFNARNRIIGVRPSGPEGRGARREWRGRGGVDGAGETREASSQRQEELNHWNETFDPGTAADGSKLCREELFHVSSLRRMRETS